MDYIITDIDCITAIENGRLIVFLKSGVRVETDSVDFLPDGGVDFGYIFNVIK